MSGRPGRTARPTKVIHINDKTDSPDEVYIGRGSLWGNPYSHLPSVISTTIQVDSREEALRLYAEMLDTRPDIMATLKLLRGKTLMCFCKPEACHGDVLARLADAIDG